MHGVWLALEQCMRHLQALRSAQARAERVSDLQRLARLALDLGPSASDDDDLATWRRLDAVYVEAFAPIMASAWARGERELAARRVRAALRAQLVREGRARFERALLALGGKPDRGEVYAELVAQYCQPQRAYHTLEHVMACLKWLDVFERHAQQPAEVELALWFHDAVYDARRGDNERLSALQASDRLRHLGVAEAAITRIASYIEATAGHVAQEGDCALMLDLDLGILGAAAQRFDAFERQIRGEYAHVLAPLYRAGRRRVLRGFLERTAIYNLPEIRERFEAQARANIARALAALK